MSGELAAPGQAEETAELRRWARLRSRWDQTTAGRRWYHHWSPAQALFLFAMVPLLVALPLDLEMLGMGGSFPSWLAPPKRGILTLLWALTLAGNAFFAFRILRWKGDEAEGGRRLLAVALASLPLLGLWVLARPVVGPRPRERRHVQAPSRSLPAFRLPERWGGLVDRLADAVEEPLVQVCWLWALNFILLLATSSWASMRAGVGLRLALGLACHLPAAATFVFDRVRPWRQRLATRLALAGVTLLPAPLSFLPVVASMLRQGFPERWTLCGDAWMMGSSMRRSAGWSAVLRRLHRHWEQLPWRLRPASGRRADPARRQVREVRSLHRVKSAAVGFEAVLVGWWWQLELHGWGLGAALRSLLLVAAVMAGWGLVETLLRLAETMRLLAVRQRTPGAGPAVVAAAVAALGLYVGSLLVGGVSPLDLLRLISLTAVLLVCCGGIGLVLFPLLGRSHLEMSVVARWCGFLFALAILAAWGTTSARRAEVICGWLPLAGWVGLVVDLAAGGIYRRRLFQPFASTGSAAGVRRGAGRAVAALVLLPGGVLVLPGWWWLAAVHGEEAG